MTIQATDEFGATGVAIPAGAVFSYAGETNPSGWLLCQGQALLRATYPQLFSAIGTSYNTQIDPTTGLAWTDPGVLYFRAPDYRGLFLRSVGTPSGLDAVTLGSFQGQKTSTSGLSIVGIGNHSHSLNNNGVRYGGAGDASGSWAGSQQGGDSPSYPYRTLSSEGGFSAAGRWKLSNWNFDYQGNHNHTIYGDNETRPINKGTQYIIKF